jgi:hypothetical protein
MEFVEVMYMLCMPLVLIYHMVFKNNYFSKFLLVVINSSLFFYFIFQCYQYYQLYQLANYFGMAPSISDLWFLGLKNKLQALQNILLLFLPFAISISLLKKNIYASVIMVLLLWFPSMMAIFNKTSFIFPLYKYPQPFIQILRVFSLYIALTGFLLLVKKIQLFSAKAN